MWPLTKPKPIADPLATFRAAIEHEVSASWQHCWQYLHAAAQPVLDGKLPLRTIECWAHKTRQAGDAAFIFGIDIRPLWHQIPCAQRILVHKVLAYANESIAPVAYHGA